jgi:hypothetical protein
MTSDSEAQSEAPSVDTLDKIFEEYQLGNATLKYQAGIDQAKAKINRLIVDEYKRGYIQGGIDEILRHDKATKELTEQLGEK